MCNSWSVSLKGHPPSPAWDVDAMVSHLGPYRRDQHLREGSSLRKLEGVRSLDDLQSLQGNLEPSNSRLLHEMEINFYSVEASVNFVLYFMQLNTYSDLIPRYKLLDC